MSTPKLGSVVDDHDHDRVARFIAGLLEVTAAFNAVPPLHGREALRMARDRRPDAVLLNIDMDLDGPNTARALREMFVNDRPILIGMTDRAMAAESKGSLLFDAVLAKPIDLVQLLPLSNAF